MTKKYELIYVLNGTLQANELRAQMERVHGIVEASAEIVDIVEWGRRRLAYEYRISAKRYYVLVYFNADPEAPREVSACCVSMILCFASSSSSRGQFCSDGEAYIIERKKLPPRRPKAHRSGS